MPSRPGRPLIQEDPVTRSARTTRSRRWTAVVVGGAATGAVLLGGGIALADGSDSTTTAPDAPSAPSAPAAGDRVVGTVTAVSDSALTVTDDTGTEHELTLSDDTRFGGGPAGGPGGGPGAGGPAGGPAPAAPADGSAPADGERPTAPPTAPPPRRRPAASSRHPRRTARPRPPRPRATPPTPPHAPAAPAAGSVDDLAVGDRVEVRVSDGAALEVREVVATVDGTVVSVDGTDLTVVTTPGLRVDVDAASLSALPAVGDDVHLQGTVADDGRSVVADDTAYGPR